jgi:hypothetical protein
MRLHCGLECHSCTDWASKHRMHHSAVAPGCPQPPPQHPDSRRWPSARGLAGDPAGRTPANTTSSRVSSSLGAARVARYPQVTCGCYPCLSGQTLWPAAARSACMLLHQAIAARCMSRHAAGHQPPGCARWLLRRPAWKVGVGKARCMSAPGSGRWRGTAPPPAACPPGRRSGS